MGHCDAGGGGSLGLVDLNRQASNPHERFRTPHSHGERAGFVAVQVGDAVWVQAFPTTA